MSAQVDIQESVESLKIKINTYQKTLADVSDLLTKSDTCPDSDLRKNIDQMKLCLKSAEIQEGIIANSNADLKFTYQLLACIAGYFVIIIAISVYFNWIGREDCYVLKYSR